MKPGDDKTMGETKLGEEHKAGIALQGKCRGQKRISISKVTEELSGIMS